MFPLVPASGKRDTFVSGEMWFEGGLPNMEPRCDLRDALRKAYDATDDGDAIILFDIDGFRDRFLNGEIVKEIRVKGRDLWFITYVRNVEDVISALTGAFAGLGIPLHTIEDESLLYEAKDLSEYVFPVAFMKDGRELSSGRGRKELMVHLGMKGFDKIMLFDTDQILVECIPLTVGMIDSAKDTAEDSNPSRDESVPENT